MNQFKVKGVWNDKEYTVYAVRRTQLGGTEFLVYICGKWAWESAGFYKPLEE